MNITTIENNFGAQDIMLRAYLSERMVILEGIIPVDTSSTLYQSADSLVLTLDTEFPFRLSSMSAAVLASGDGMDCYATLLPCAIGQSRNLTLHKLPVYDGRENVRIYLNTAFSQPGVTALLGEGEPLPLTAKQDGTRTVPLMRHYTDRIEQEWAYLAGVFSEQSFRADRENSFTLEGFPEDIDTCLPIFTSDFDADRAPGTRIYAARLSSGVLTFNPGDINAYDRQREAFMSAFFVRGEQSN